MKINLGEELKPCKCPTAKKTEEYQTILINDRKVIWNLKALLFSYPWPKTLSSRINFPKTMIINNFLFDPSRKWSGHNLLQKLVHCCPLYYNRIAENDFPYQIWINQLSLVKVLLVKNDQFQTEKSSISILLSNLFQKWSEIDSYSLVNFEFGNLYLMYSLSKLIKQL